MLEALGRFSVPLLRAPSSDSRRHRLATCGTNTHRSGKRGALLLVIPQRAGDRADVEESISLLPPQDGFIIIAAQPRHGGPDGVLADGYQPVVVHSVTPDGREGRQQSGAITGLDPAPGMLERAQRPQLMPLLPPLWTRPTLRLGEEVGGLGHGTRHRQHVLL